MANQQDSDKPANAVPGHGDHDRIQMLSLHSDGTPAQVAPELIGGKDTTLEATTEQFRQQAVSAADVELRTVNATESEKDPDVLKAAHDKAAKAAESAAKSTVDALHQG